MMTSVERIYALCKAVEYLSAAQIPSDLVECGVWRGGLMMCAALTLLQAGDTTRRLSWQSKRTEDSYIWGYAPLEAVRRNMASTGYPEDQVSFVCGPVEQTIPVTVPKLIALLRDWTRTGTHQPGTSLITSSPTLWPGGVLIVDDYGHWEGARRAIDEYFAASDVKVLLNRIDYTGRIGVRC